MGKYQAGLWVVMVQQAEKFSLSGRNNHRYILHHISQVSSGFIATKRNGRLVRTGIRDGIC